MTEDRLKQRILLAVVILIVTMTAVFQRLMVEKGHLNSWKGGGFGMFADSPTFRVMKIIPVDSNNIGYVTPVPNRAQKKVKKILYLPTERRLQQFARELVRSKWVLIGLEAGENKQYPVLEEEAIKHPTSRPIRLKGIKIELYDYTFDRRTNQVVSKQLLVVREYRES